MFRRIAENFDEIDQLITELSTSDFIITAGMAVVYGLLLVRLYDKSFVVYCSTKEETCESVSWERFLLTFSRISDTFYLYLVFSNCSTTVNS